MNGHEILVIPAARPDQGGRGILSERLAAPVKLNGETLRANLATFIETMNTVVADLPEIGRPFQLEEISLVLEISAEGSVQLLGGVKVGASGGITLKLKK